MTSEGKCEVTIQFVFIISSNVIYLYKHFLQITVLRWMWHSIIAESLLDLLPKIKYNNKNISILRLHYPTNRLILKLTKHICYLSYPQGTYESSEYLKCLIVNTLWRWFHIVHLTYGPPQALPVDLLSHAQNTRN